MLGEVLLGAVRVQVFEEADLTEPLFELSKDNFKSNSEALVAVSAAKGALNDFLTQKVLEAPAKKPALNTVSSSEESEEDDFAEE